MNGDILYNTTMKEAELRKLWSDVITEHTDDDLTHLAGRAEYDKHLEKLIAGSTDIKGKAKHEIMMQLLDQLVEFVEFDEFDEDGVHYLEGTIKIKA